MQVFFPTKRLFAIMGLYLMFYGPAQSQIGHNTWTDVGLHFAVSAEISFATCMYITLEKPQMSLTNKYLIATGVGAFVGVGKEVLDKLTHSDFDLSDIAIDLVGVGTGLVLHYFIIDRKRLRATVALNCSPSEYTAALVVRF